MKNFMSLLKLDTRLVTPYWKWLVLFTGIALLFGILSQNGSNFMFSFAIFAGTFTAFNFENTDKSNLNVLFATLPTNRKSMLNARYTFILLVLVLSVMASLGGGLVLDLIFGNTIYFDRYLMMFCLTIGIYLFSTGFQTPFFYGMGYVKGKIFLWIPIIVIVVVVNLHGLFDAMGVDINFDVFDIMLNNMLVTNIVAISVGTVAIVSSYFISRRIYLRKDF